MAPSINPKISSMKTRTLILTLTLIMAGFAVASAQIVTNGDFESGNLDGWVVSDGQLSEAGDAIYGDYSFIKLWGNSDLLISQVVEVEPGKEYTLSYFTDRSWNWIYVHARIFDNETDDLLAEVSTHSLEEPSAMVDFVAPSHGSARIEFSKTADEPGKIWIDDIVIEEKSDEPIVTNLMVNGDFETGDFTGWESLADNTLIQSAETMGDPSQLIDGEYSCYKNWGDGDFISQVVGVDAGTEYTLSYLTFMALNNIHIYARVYDMENEVLIAETFVNTKDPIEGSLDFTAPQSGSVKVLFAKWTDENTDPARVGIDNVTLVAKSAGSMLVNGDFETGDLTGWENHAENGFVQSVDDIPAENADQIISGTYTYFKNWGAGDMVSQVIEVEAGKEYTFSYKGFIAWDWIYVYGRVFDASDNSEIAETFIYKRDTLETSVDFIAPESGSIEIRFHKWADSPGRAGIDDVTLVEKAGGDPTSVPQLDDYSLNSGIHVYPNPSTGVFNLNVTDDLIGKNYQVYDIIGNIVFDGIIMSNDCPIDLTGMKSGIYIVSLISQNQRITKKISLR